MDKTIAIRTRTTGESKKMTTGNAVIYTRVSSREQEQEGFSLDAQSKLLREYANRNSLQIVQTFEDVETAKTTGRKQFGEMLAFFTRHRATCRILLVEKTDRLYRNPQDAIKVEDLDIETHFVKENQILSKTAKSQDKFMHDIRVAVARNYSENLREEVKKGMSEKADQGTLPGRAPFGYRNRKDTRTIEIDPIKGPIAHRAYELYASGQHTLVTLSKELKRSFGMHISKTNLHKMLTNPFYIGKFRWSGKTYVGAHSPIVSSDLFGQVESVIRGHNRPKYRKVPIAFRGLMCCAICGCTITGEFKKGKYVYYRCSYGHGYCTLPRFREQEIADQLANVLADLTVPEHIGRAIVSKLQDEQRNAGAHLAQQRARLKKDLSTIQARMDAAYSDRLDGKISEEFWQRKQADWSEDELRIKNQMATLKEPSACNDLANVGRILELAQKAHSLYLTRNPTEQADLLRKVLWNCGIDGVNLYPSYRKPFDMIARRAKNEEWSGREDLNLRPPGPEPGALPG